MLQMTLWDLLNPPSKDRNPKPRTTGITMLIDKGLSLSDTRNLLKLNAGFIDLIKLAFGTLCLYEPQTLAAKINLVKKHGIGLYPGGTFWELAYWRHKTTDLYPRLRDLGFEWLEISDGTLTISPQERRALIGEARQSGFQVITEVGKKEAAAQLSREAIAQQVQMDLADGAAWVIIEARESGAGIGIYNQQGQLQKEMIAFLGDCLPLLQVIWEAPLKQQQAELITIFGPNVNLGNIPPTEAMALEALRLGLRSDTWKQTLHK
jgi:phosphosulfolactate synthase